MTFSLDTLPLHDDFYALGNDFYTAIAPTPFKTASELIHFNPAAAQLLDLSADIAHDPQFVPVFSGQRPLQHAQPFAMLYSGHQFGHYNPQLGDGRAIIIAEAMNQQQEKWELQIKGSGLTPYSRDGDGRAVLRSTIREYLASEAMAGLGIPTTRALCIIGSDDEVYREKIERGAMLTRMAPSHVRFGSFEIFYYRRQFKQLGILADYVIQHHYPELQHNDNPHLDLLQTVIDRTAKLIADWQAVGFAHGVMNTDNMSILGLTLDYGPYGFLDQYQEDFICNHSDYQGRYAFDQQPMIGLFNLSCLAQALLPLLHVNPDKAAEMAKQQLADYQSRYIHYFTENMRRKLGLQTLAENDALLSELLALLHADRVDYTIFFRHLAEFDSHYPEKNTMLRDMFMQREKFDHWALQYQQRLQQEQSNDAARCQAMQKVNPKYILRNYMAETAIRMAEEKDYSEIDRLFQLLQNPFDEQPHNEQYAAQPPDWANDISVSCSS